MKARITLEMMGSPPEIVEKALKQAEERIRAEYKVINVRYEKPTKVGELYFSVFFEMELEFDTLDKMFGFVLDFGPSTFEILETKTQLITPASIQDAANDVSATLHALLRQITELKAQLKIQQRQALEEKVKIQQDLKNKETKTEPETKKPIKKPKTKKKTKK